MTEDGPNDLTRERDLQELFPLLYAELRNLARHRLSAEPAGQTIQPTALVHEAFLRLSASGGQRWKSRAYFFAAAAEAMRRILIDRARAKQADRRGSAPARVELDEWDAATPEGDESLLALDAALEKLSAKDSEKAQLVKLKFFAGLTTEQAAEMLQISEATAKRSWAFARAWLAREMKRDLA
jgi:RNA polymerase sigma factor (TIGR02999 family)